MSAVSLIHAGDTKKTDEVTLKGKIGCSACNYGVSKECGVSFKAADGKIYTLNKPSNELMSARHDEGTLQVTVKVTEKDGRLFVDATKAELVK